MEFRANRKWKKSMGGEEIAGESAAFDLFPLHLSIVNFR